MQPENPLAVDLVPDLLSSIKVAHLLTLPAIFGEVSAVIFMRKNINGEMLACHMCKRPREDQSFTDMNERWVCHSQGF